jgi:hypothetical protein
MTAELSAASLATIASMTQAELDHAAAHLWDRKPNGRPVYTTAERLALLYALQPVPPEVEELTDAEVLAALEELPGAYPEELTPEGIQLAMFPPADPKPRKGDSTAQLALW